MTTPVETYDWQALEAHLDRHGWTTLPHVREAEQCREIAALYDDDARFRGHIWLGDHPRHVGGIGRFTGCAAGDTAAAIVLRMDD